MKDIYDSIILNFIQKREQYNKIFLSVCRSRIDNPVLSDILVTNELVMMLKKNYISQYENVKILWNSIFRKCMGIEYSQLIRSNKTSCN